MKKALFALLLFAGAAKGQDTLRIVRIFNKPEKIKLDTIPVVMLITDTSEPGRVVAWQERGYQVRLELCCIQRETGNFALAGFVPYYEHLKYLDSKKQPIKLGYYVWVSIKPF